MRRMLVRYMTKPERTGENEQLVKQVFEELHAKAPQDVRYLALKLDDGTFVHFVENASKESTNPIPTLAAFRAFQNGIKERCTEPPQSAEVTIVGNYRMLDE